MPYYRDDPCPARGVALSHMQDYRQSPDGACTHCGVPLEPRVTPLEELFLRPSADPQYGERARLHSTDGMKAHRSQRIMLARAHASATLALYRAATAERLDPVPDFLPE